MGMDVDLMSLRVLRAIAETGSLGGAGRALGMTQQAVSQRLRRLEVSVGAPLASRDPRGARLSETGEVVLSWAQDLLLAAENLGTAIETLRTDRVVSITIAASLTIAEHFVPHWLLALHAAGEPERARIELIAEDSTAVIESVRSGSALLGFIETPDVPEDLACRTIGHDRLAVVVAPSHAWAVRRDPLTRAELAATPLITRERGSGTRRAFEAYLEDPRDPLPMAPPSVELPTASGIRLAVASGHAPAVLSYRAVAEQVHSGLLREVPLVGEPIDRPLTAIWRSGAIVSPVAVQFLEIAAALQAGSGGESSSAH